MFFIAFLSHLYLLLNGLQLQKHRRIRILFFVLFGLRFDFGGFIYAIALAACEFLYRKNNEYYEIKKKRPDRRPCSASSILLAIEISTPWVSSSPLFKDLSFRTMASQPRAGPSVPPEGLYLSLPSLGVPRCRSRGPLSPRSLRFPSSPHFATRLA